MWVWVKECHWHHRWLGMVNIPPIKIVIWEDGLWHCLTHISVICSWRPKLEFTSGTAQGGGGSSKDRKPIAEVICCDSWMAERTDGSTGGCEALSFLFYLIIWHYLCIYLPIYLSAYLPIYPSTCLSTYLSIVYISIIVYLSLSIYIIWSKSNL